MNNMMLQKRLFIFSLLIFSSTFLSHLVHAAQQRPIIAVLYFDNNSNQKKLDILKKGFADMMISDLSRAGLSIVEREKLQTILKELKLQRTKYFNSKLQQKLGKGLGATHLLQGTFLIHQKLVRIDIRLFSIATAKIILSRKIEGKKDNILALQERLVQDFLNAYRPLFTNAKTKSPKRNYQFRSKASPQTLNALVDYSKALDLIDRGKLEDAKNLLISVQRQLPRLALKELRSLKRKLKRLRIERAITFNKKLIALEQKLRKSNHGKAFTARNEKEMIRFIHQEYILSLIQLRKLRQYLSPTRISYIRKGKKKIFIKEFTTYHQAIMQLLHHIYHYEKKHTQKLSNGVHYHDLFRFSFSEQERYEFRVAGFKDPRLPRTEMIVLTHANLLFTGIADDKSIESFLPRIRIAPIPIIFDPHYYAKATKLYQTLIQSQKKKPEHSKLAQTIAIQALEYWAVALMDLGKTKEAIAKLQRILKEYPTTPIYKRIEKKTQEFLGTRHNHWLNALRDYEKGIKSCDSHLLNRSLSDKLHHQSRLYGLESIQPIIDNVIKNCKNKLRRYALRQLYQSAALRAGRSYRCKLFERWMKKAMLYGMTRKEIHGYRKNYTPCPVP